jgi:predicted AlkP superfamily phosphohydrolase/phosphomutase
LKTILIGVDGGTNWIIDRLKLKGFEELKESGFFGGLNSLLPFQSEPSWPSIYTGNTPRKHGIIEFFYLKEDYEKDYKYFEPNVTKPFWDEIDGKKIVVNAPLIVKPYKINGILVTGWPYSPKSYPKEIERLTKKFGFVGEEIEGENLLRKGDRKGYSVLLKRMKAMKNLSTYLLKNYDFEFSFFVFSELDRAQHFSLGEKNWKKYTYPFYKVVDDFLRFCLNTEVENVFVVSDHGFQRIKGKFLINTYLVKKGFAKLKEPSKLSKIKYSIREKIMRSKLRKTYDTMPQLLRTIARKIFMLGFSSGTVANVARIHSFDFDMKKTKVFASISNSPVAMLFINDSRFSKGIIDKKEREKIKEEVKKELLKEKVVKEIVDGKEYYKGIKGIILPDLLLVAKEGYFFSIYDYNAKKVYDKPEYAKGGDHYKKGIFGGFSKNTKLNKALRKIQLEKASIIDVAPTLLRIYNKKLKCEGKSLIPKL